ncbi:hypothetical protein ACFVT5_13335 [Streptomyces sp. NPDC058001]|uniref:hypothetical protein n=1 Tax=Streptomyces sp. NPDC058001 TaxID=3346300 RepID=UPI0036ECE375
MAKPPVPPGFRRLTVELPTDLVEWLWAFAEISHRTVDDVVRPLVEEEKARVEANWTTSTNRTTRSESRPGPDTEEPPSR